MKLDRIKFARLISYLSRNAGGTLCIDEIQTIDNMIDIDVKPVPVPFVDAKLVNELLKAMKHGQKIEAVKAYRSLTGLELKEAMRAVEAQWSYFKPKAENQPVKLSDIGR